MSNNEFEIRFYQEGDESQIIYLFEKVYKKQITLDWWKWRYLRNPSDKPQIALAFSGDQLVSHYAVSPVFLSKRKTKIDQIGQAKRIFPKDFKIIFKCRLT